MPWALNLRWTKRIQKGIEQFDIFCETSTDLSSFVNHELSICLTVLGVLFCFRWLIVSIGPSLIPLIATLLVLSILFINLEHKWAFKDSSVEKIAFAWEYLLDSTKC